MTGSITPALIRSLSHDVVLRANKGFQKYRMNRPISANRTLFEERVLDKRLYETKPMLLSKKHELRLAFQFFPKTGPENLKKIERIVVFGDSLSASEGFMQQKTSGILLSNHSYYKGRFTNGFVWTDFLESPNFLGKEVVNFAEGGTAAVKYGSMLNLKFQFISNLGRQIDQFQKMHDFSEKDLVIVWVGANDYITYQRTDVPRVISNIEKNLSEMIKNGVKKILVIGIPDLSKTPLALSKDDNFRQDMYEISCMHNSYLKELVSKLSNDNVKITFFDSQKAFNSLIDAAEIEGVNTQDAYNKDGYVSLFTRAVLDPLSNHVFLDQVHPSQTVHAILAAKIQGVIESEYGEHPDR
ncbi:SGNH/GDSL hydrolase family protein [Spartinivicinus ruber]|uniref:SGNH/GDSL hydrolase family protein n=1 Tax=Spartinivicinus ruber TaxID=2683272 RepID=UPI0013D1B132|nr:SGNH/GDSL hydrolase family protein [Spartinivicinus ruber]